jgi:tRNA pseudouridine32 synthase/23S rRNA pseudouridine746 synthase
VGADRVEAMLRERRIVDGTARWGRTTRTGRGNSLWFHRDLPVEVPVPFVRGRPAPRRRRARGRQAALSSPRSRGGATSWRPRWSGCVATWTCPELSPAHRLDRVTAGGASVRGGAASSAGPYQTLFRDRRVRKTYEAVARHDPALELPRTVRSRIVKERRVILAQQVPGPPNAETRVELRRGTPAGWAATGSPP